MKAVAAKAGLRLALSGTSVENKLSELWSIFDFALPGYLGTLKEFGEEFSKPIERDKDQLVVDRLRRATKPYRYGWGIFKARCWRDGKRRRPHRFPFICEQCFAPEAASAAWVRLRSRAAFRFQTLDTISDAAMGRFGLLCAWPCVLA